MEYWGWLNNMKQVELDKKAYNFAKQYLLNLQIVSVTPKLLDKYLCLSEITPRPDSLAKIYKSLLESAQNANMKAGVIGKAIGGVEKLKPVLCGFDPPVVITKFEGWEQVLELIEKELKPAGKIRKTSRSLWPQYCKTILSGASFLSEFATADEFYSWVDFFDQDDRARPALPMLLSQEINGLGFPLSCDFLKELGYVNFAKPDVHLKEIFKSIGLCSSEVKDYEVFKAIVRVAKNVSTTPYDVDKLFWLIGSGYFYDDKHIGNNGKIGSHKKDFITQAQKALNVTLPAI